MSIAQIAEIDLLAVRNRATLFAFLRDKLAWPVDPEDTFMYQGPQLHGDVATRASVSQIVPFTTGDPFTIMLVEFESGFRRTDLREILRLMRQEIRTRAKYEGRKLDEIIFVCTECEAKEEEQKKEEQKEQDYCGVRFAHFEEQEGRQAKISVFGWDKRQPGSVRTLIEYNLPALVMPMRNMLGETDWIQAKWREAWDVAKVTGRFYDDYKDVFKWAETQITGVVGDQRLFTQRLFNRMMFIHFLSKKGWLRFNGNRDYFAALWSGRDKGQNFYRAHLWPLFSHGLNNPHIQHNNAANQSRFGDVPYLNGGLFEKAASDEQGEEIPDAVFERIFGLFARWNFTVTESTPLDVEVAVDPEMLGKVFEELVTGRHETGSYYTPRPVVMFMCREALKGYLTDAFGSEYTDAVAGFVDEAKTDGLPREELVLDALKRVRACDPACGSGAYLLGMMQELLRLRETLFRARPDDYKSIYDRKLEIIERNLYGADKDEFAVSIAMLRLWLSLVVDDGRSALTQPRPDVSLPNLKFKICIGDSLTAPAPDLAALAMFRAEYEKDANQLHALYERYFRLSRDKSSGSKVEIEKRIEAVQSEISKLLESACDDTVVDWRVCFAEVFAPRAAVQTMDGRFAFTNDVTAQQAFVESDSDTERSGFDIVMANPPYVRQELLGKEYKEMSLKPVFPAVYSGTADLYCYFYARALQLLRPGGMLAFISPNKWFRAGYGANLRKHIAETCRVVSITDFGELPVFETAATFPMIFVAQRHNKNVITPPPYLLPLSRLENLTPCACPHSADRAKTTSRRFTRFRLDIDKQ